jgi:hypothetical protein
VPTLLLCSGSGMAAGGWLAGAIYDYAGFYAVAFAIGIVFNFANLLVVGTLVFRQTRLHRCSAGIAAGFARSSSMWHSK